VRWFLYVVACMAGLVLALLGDEPLLGLLIAAIILYPLGTGLIIRADTDSRGPRMPSLGPAITAGLAGTLLVVFLVRLAVDAPSWVDPTSADCGGPSTSVQSAAVWLAAAVFILAAIPEAITVTAIGRRLRNATGPSFPVSLSFFPIAVAFSGLALIVVSFVTTC
jgi:hypothetical protein